MATLKDIGHELGLSAATVSRALNGFPEVNARTRSRVRETAERLGYRPNRIAQRLVTGRSGMVGMILRIKPDMSVDETFFEGVTGLTAALSAHEIDLVLAVDQGTDPVEPYRRMLERDILDGFVVNAPRVDDPRLQFLQQKEIPFVVHGRDSAAPLYAYYDIDNRAVATQAVDLLGNLGHRRIAYLNGEMRRAYAGDRDAGFHDRMQALGLSAESVGDLTGDQDGYTVTLRLLAEPERPTAIVCASTTIAGGVMRAISDRGLRIPQDISVMAHDDALPLTRARNFSPALTVTRAPLRDACVPLATMLHGLLDGGDTASCQQLDTAELIVRDSTGPAPKEI